LNVGIEKPIEAKIVDDCRKAKIFPEPDATKCGLARWGHMTVRLKKPMCWSRNAKLTATGHAPPHCIVLANIAIDGTGGPLPLRRSTGECRQSLCGVPCGGTPSLKT
jgi:hypothetical protein